MTSAGNTGAGTRSKKEPSFGQMIVDDLRQGLGLGRTLRRDLRNLYDFYVDEDRRAELARKNPFVRWLHVSLHVLRALFVNLTPQRRLMLLAGVILSIQGRIEFRSGDVRLSTDTHILGLIVVLLVLALELKDKLLAKDELQIGRQVQTALLPKTPPSVPGWDIWIYTRPANDVGGDLVDYLTVRDGVVGIALGDVAGKGLGAALLAAKLQSTLRALAPDSEDLVDLGQRVNHILCRDGLPNRFATLVFLEVTANGNGLDLLNAGHLPPHVLHAAGITSLAPVAPPLGLFDESRYESQSVVLQPGDTLLVHSDGLSEARNARGEFFGEVILERLLPSLRILPAATIGERLLREAQLFVGDEPYEDDLSLVIVQRRVGGEEDR